MKKSFFWLIVLLILLTTYKPKFSFISGLNFNIQKIIVENNLILESSDIIQKINFLYDENLFFLDIREIEENLRTVTFIESFIIKKIYPNKLKITIKESKPVAILQNKKEKFYITEKGKLIKFINLKNYKNLPTVFGNGKAFYSLYKDLQTIEFRIDEIKSFYFFESGRWDLIMYNEKIIKLPIKDHLLSLENYMRSKSNINFNNYKIYDYRIKDQLILN
jgi:cell division septal protein FtsQ